MLSSALLGVQRCAASAVLRRALSVSSLSASSDAAASVVPGVANVFSEDELMLRDSVRRMANDVIAPRVQAMDEQSKMAPEVIEACFQQGLMGVSVPTQYGGSGMSFTSSVIVIDELARVDPAVSVMVDVQNTLVNNLVERFGSEYIRETCLPRLTKDTLGSFCLSEASSGSDAFALKARAEEKGDYFVLNGNKMWITNAGEAGLYFVMANVNPSAGYKGITCFMVERGTPGLSIGKKENKLGIRASSTCEVVLQDVKVPKKNVVGQVGQGYKIAIGTLNEGRIGIGAQMLGLAHGALDYVMKYMHERQQFGKRIADFQGMQFQYAHAAMEIEAAGLMVYNAARMKDAGLDFVKEAAMAKLFSSLVAERVASRGVEWAGGVGFTKDFLFEKYYRDSKIGQIYEGTSNMLLQTIAKMMQRDFQ